MKKVAFAIVAVLALLVAFTLVRTALVVKPAMPAAQSPVFVDSRIVAQHLGAAIRFRTLSADDGRTTPDTKSAFAAMRIWLARTYPHLQKATSHEMVGDVLLLTWKGASEPKPILLLSHLDVAPVAPGSERAWAHGPFSGDVAGGYVWGRGAIDDKGAAVAILEAGERLAKQGFTPRPTIMFAFASDGEGRREGAHALADQMTKRGVHFRFVLDEGATIVEEPFPGVTRPMAFLGVAEKGEVALELVAHGQGGPAARPTHDLAIVRLSEAVLKLANHPFSYGLDNTEQAKLAVIAAHAPFPERFLLANLWLTEPIVLRLIETGPEGTAELHTTMAPTYISGGFGGTVLPPEARATFDLRLSPRDSLAAAIDHVRKAIDDPKVDVIAQPGGIAASAPADLGSPAYAYVSGQIAQMFGGIPVAPVTATSATEARYFEPVSDAAFRFLPFRFGPSELGRVHGTNERLAVRNLAPAVAFYMHLIENAR